MKILASLTLALLLASSSLRADDFTTVSSGSNQVDGLTLPADMKVPPDAGIVKITAKADGPVKFSVLGSVPGVKAEAAGKSVIVSIPPQPGAQIAVFAWTVISKKGPDGKLTSAEPSEIARTNILVDGPAPAPTPDPAPPKPQPKQPKLVGKGYMTLIYDPQDAPAPVAAVLNSAKLRGLADLAVKVCDVNDPFLKAKKLVGKFGAVPWLVVQNSQGEIVASQALPDTDDAVLALVAQLRQ